MYAPSVSPWARLRDWLRDDAAPDPVIYGCAYCADDQNRWYGHVTQIASSEERGTILIRCPRCETLYESTPAGTAPERWLTVEEADRLFPGDEGPEKARPEKPV